MLNVSKEEALNLLSKIDDVIFVGGTSEYLQGIKDNLNDIDISVSSIEPLKKFGYVFTSFDSSFYGLSGNRGNIPLRSVMIDIFIDAKKPNYITVDGFKCETLDSMIALRENTLKYTFSGTLNNYLKIYENLKRLKVLKNQDL